MNHARDLRRGASESRIGTNMQVKRVGDTGIEPVTSSVSGKRSALVSDPTPPLTWPFLCVDTSGHPWTNTPDRERNANGPHQWRTAAHTVAHQRTSVGGCTVRQQATRAAWLEASAGLAHREGWTVMESRTTTALREQIVEAIMARTTTESSVEEIAAAVEGIVESERAGFERLVHGRVWCPNHNMPDCSPLLNGCSLVNHITNWRDGMVARAKARRDGQLRPDASA